MTREEIEQKMDELARKYADTHDPEIPEEIYQSEPRAGEDGEAISKLTGYCRINLRLAC